MLHCQHCGTDNLDGSEFCDECGMRLAPTASRVNKYTPPPPPMFTTESVQPKPAQPFTSPPEAVVPPPKAEALPSRPEPIPEPVVVPTPEVKPSPAAPQAEATPDAGRNTALSGDATQVVDRAATQFIRAVKQPVSYGTATGARLVVVRGGQVGKEFPLTGTEAMIGRWDADRGIFPDIDLDADDPEAKVSRRHARIIIQGDRYFVEDLGSTNGTFVNRQHRLRPNQPYPLGNGDEIIVGKTFLKLVIS